MNEVGDPIYEMEKKEQDRYNNVVICISTAFICACAVIYVINLPIIPYSL